MTGITAARDFSQAKKNWGPKPPSLLRRVFQFPQDYERHAKERKDKNQHHGGIDLTRNPAKERNRGHHCRENTRETKKCTHKRLQKKERERRALSPPASD
jgi:hypothetical protein